jgi:hypothetical protein
MVSSDRLFLNSPGRSFGSVLHSAIVTALTKERLPGPLQLSCPERRVCFTEKQSHGQSVLPQGKTEISSFAGSHQRSDSPLRKEEHSLALVKIHLQWSYPLALELALHSSIVTDLPVEKTVPKVASVSK